MFKRSWFAVLLMLLAAPAFAGSHDDVIPLRHGELGLHALNSALSRELNLPRCPLGGRIDLSTAEGDDFLFAVNACLWDGCSLSRNDREQVVLHVEDRPAPDTFDAVRRFARVYAAERAPKATAAQARRWGLLTEGVIDPARPLVVLVHGLDADRSDCMPMGNLLRDAGHQVAYFSYPAEQPIPESAARLARSIHTLRASYPGIRIDFVAHSMGGLVARQYVEGPDYAGEVNHLIMVAPPNAGSKWASLRLLLSVQENYALRRSDPEWNWSWIVTEGLGEAGRELKPDSPFLRELNSRPRRDGVRYTIIAGSKSGVERVEANWIDTASHWIPVRARPWWGIRNCYARLDRKAARLREQIGDSDGPVTVGSARLAGVSDVVILPADHVSLYLPVDGRPPAAWAVVNDRLR